MSDAFIVSSELSFSWPDDTPVFQRLSFTVGEGRTGLVAPNGAGKSTLLRLIAGQLQPTGGTVSVAGALGHLPQSLPLVRDLTVAEVLGIAPVIAALHAIESGDVTEAHLATIGNDWDIEERTKVWLERFDLADVALPRRLDTLSGGQIVSLGVAAQLLKQPDVLLLDEPTNNLDLHARHKLYGVIDDCGGCLLVVSHDRALLDRMDRIAELDRREVRFYGGNFTEYEHAMRAGRDVAERNVRNAEHEIKREKRDMQQARERAERRASNASRNLKNAGLPKIVAGTLKRNAQESASRSNTLHTKRVRDARARLDAAVSALRDEQKIVLDLPNTNVPAGRTVFLGEYLQVRYGERDLFGGRGIDLTIQGPERIAVVGSNGAGKSTLLRLIHGDIEPAGGHIKRAAGRIAYLSQQLDLLDLNRSLVENLAAFTPAMPHAQRLNLLARFLFRGSRVHLPLGVLSGGERLRATLACVLYAEPAPQLLLLDEPTNNLDVVTIGQLESALGAYQGALVVVSHDERFLGNINISRWLALSRGRLVETSGIDESAEVRI